MLAAIASAASALLAAVYPIYPVLCVCAMLSGGATGASAIALQRQVGRMAETPADLKTIFSWLSIGPAAANFIGPLVAGLVIDHFGFRSAFATLTLFPVIAWLCGRTAAAQSSSPIPERSSSATAWQLLREPMFRRLLLVNFFVSSCWDVHNLAVPIIGHERGFSASVIGSILATYAIASTLVRTTIPMIASRLKEWVVIVCAMLMICLAFALYPFQHSALGMGACSFMVGFAMGMVNPMVMSALHQITPDERQGEALGLRMTFINACSVAVPVLFGALGAAAGISTVLWLTAMSVGSASTLALKLKHVGTRGFVKA